MFPGRENRLNMVVNNNPRETSIETISRENYNVEDMD